MNWNAKTHGRGFLDRVDAGQQLGRRLKKYERHADALVLGLTPGGMAVANEVAEVLYLPLRPLLVRPLTAPQNSAAAVGVAISGGLRYVHPEALLAAQVQEKAVEAETISRSELEKQATIYGAGATGFFGRVLIVVDEGLPPGSLLPWVLRALRLARPERLVVGVPVAERATLEAVRSQADEALDLMAPEDFAAVGEWYSDFPPLADRQIRALLEKAARREAGKEDFKDDEAGD